MSKYKECIGLYSENGHWLADVWFKYKWQSRVFHFLLNKSEAHVGSRYVNDTVA